MKWLVVGLMVFFILTGIRAAGASNEDHGPDWWQWFLFAVAVGVLFLVLEVKP